MIATLVVGLAISILQVATQLQEMTLSYIPKLLAAAIVMVMTGPWMLSEMSRFARELLLLIPDIR